MALILTRSPFSMSRQGFDAGVQMTLEIGVHKQGVFGVLDTYNFNFRSSFYLELSKIISDYFSIEAAYSASSGRYISTGDVDVLSVRTSLQARTGGSSSPDVVETYIATNGYLNNTDAINYDFTNDLKSNAYYAGSSDIIYKLDDSNVKIPLLNPFLDPFATATTEVATISFMSKGQAKQTITHTFDSETISTLYADVENFSGISFLDRASADGAIIESSRCSDNFFRNIEVNDLDAIIISTPHSVKKIKVVSVSECKYMPYKIIFKNKLGVYEDLWFFKKSSKSIEVNSDKFNANQFVYRSAGILARSTTEFNKNGKESITLNSGFVSEHLNESFKQLMLSESVILYDFTENTKHAVLLSKGSFDFKTVTNDKLINYTMDVEFSNNAIDDIF
tara:strand:+ start:313 stop:1491 length:1179 start_codon:yes stop_codon:yes gene_type:complete